MVNMYTGVTLTEPSKQRKLLLLILCDKLKSVETKYEDETESNYL